MKQNAKLKKPQPRKRLDNKPTSATARPFPLFHWVLVAVALFLVAGATWAAFEFVVYSKIPNRLVGRWVIEGGEQDGATLDFFRNGTMIGNMNVQGSLAIVNARVRVEGDKLFITTQNPMTKQDETRAQLIKRLTDEELVLEDGQGKLFRLSRAID
jgi:uncharacterized protein (TIGR03066 family)